VLRKQLKIRKKVTARFMIWMQHCNFRNFGAGFISKMLLGQPAVVDAMGNIG
jgi:hypothetical protein